MSTNVPLAKLPTVYAQLPDINRFVAAGALNDIAFKARSAVIARKNQKFNIKQKWVANNTRVFKADKRQDPIMAQVTENYWGLAQQERGGSRPGSKPDPWFIPNKKGKEWMAAQGFKKTPTIKKLLKAGGDKKPFILRKKGQPVGKQITPSDIDSGKNILAVRTSGNRNTFDVIGTLQDAPLKFKKTEFFEDTVAKVYDDNIQESYSRRYNAELQNRLARA